MQPIDVGQGSLQLSSSSGLLACDTPENLPAEVRKHLGQEFVSFHTTGDGGCGIHAGWGHPNDERMLEFPGGQARGRELMMNLLPETLGELEARLGAWPHARSVIESLWRELTLPAACGVERKRESDTVSYTHLTLPTNREV